MKKTLSILALTILLPLASYADGVFEIHIQKGHLFFALKCDSCRTDEAGESKPLRTYIGLYEGDFDIEPLLEQATYFDLGLHYAHKYANETAFYFRDRRTYFAQLTPESLRLEIVNILYTVSGIYESLLNFRFFNSEMGDTPLGADVRSETIENSIKIIAFPITDEQAENVLAFIDESIEKEHTGELQLQYKSHNCIHFTEEAYKAAGLNNTEGDFWNHVMSESGLWAQDATIVNLLEAGNKGELTLAAALYHYLFR